jgi:hypothetical protein
MSAPAALLHPRRNILPAAPLTSERRFRHRVYLTYGLLYFNTLTYYPGLSFIHIPSIVGKGIAQATLPFALLCALSLNRNVTIRPNVFLSLVTLQLLGTILTTLQPEHLGTIFRTFRFGEFIAALWLLTPLWGRRDVILLRSHLLMLSGALVLVLLGLMLSPHTALSGGGTGRLGGALWPMPPTQVAHYSAVTIGLVVVLWFCRKLSGWATLLIVAVALVVLLLSHTRTALVALTAALLVAGLSLIRVKPRVRKLFAIAGAVTAVAILTLSSVITTWLERGQSTAGLENLTGRTEVWGPLLASPRDEFQVLFGFGLSNASFNGFPIDSNWLASYEEQGLYGVVICAAILVFLLVYAYFRPCGLQRALALFLITYCLVASFTEDAFTDVSPYLLDLFIAASLLMPPLISRATDYESVPDSVPEPVT